LEWKRECLGQVDNVFQELNHNILIIKQSKIRKTLFLLSQFVEGFRC
jgi:hypothetical protein